MGLLEHVVSGERWVLAATHLVGRSRTCQLRIEAEAVSGIHAELSWLNDGGWCVRDRGSRNGTFVDGHRVGAGETRTLHPNNRVAFGQDSACYRLVDATPPVPMAVSESGQARIAEDNALLRLPSPEVCEISVYRGPSNEWVLETESELSAAFDQQWVVAGGEAWRLSLPVDAPKTSESPHSRKMHLSEVLLRLVVSQDGEHVQVHLHNARSTVLLPARTSHFLLLELAQTRISDANDHLPASEQGWMYRDDLCKRLNVDPELLNLWIFRCRKQFSSLTLLEGGQIVESRPLTHQVRIGVTKLELEAP